MSILGKLRYSIAEKLIPTEHLLEEKAKWEQERIDAKRGEFDDNEQAILDANEELESINKALEWRRRYA